MDYEKDIKIDQDALDVEWLQQASLTYKYSKHSIEAKQEMDLAKQRLDVLAAVLDNRIRKNPEKWKLTKVVNDTVLNAVITSAEYQEAYEEYLEYRYEYEMSKVAVSSLQEKKSALENLVRLHGQSYFAGPSVPRDLSKEWERNEERKAIDNNIAQKMKRRRKQ